MGFSLKIEYIALVINVILLFFSYEEGVWANIKRKNFLTCLLTSIICIFVNVASVFFMGRLSDGMAIFLSAAYYLAVMLNVSFIAGFLVQLMTQHVPQCNCTKIIYTTIVVLYAVTTVLVILNFWNGCLFTIQDGVYTRGPLNVIGYLFSIIEGCMLLICYLRNRQYMNIIMIKLVHILPPILILMLLLQMLHRDILLNGIIGTLVNLMMFIVSQSSSVELDPLTELKNRTAFITLVSNRINKRKQFQIISICLREFFNINYTYGHATGNEFLYYVAKYCREFSPEGKAFRSGGVEFNIILPFTSEEEAKKNREAIYQRFLEPWEVPNATSLLKACIVDNICHGDIELNELLEEVIYAENIAKQNKETSVFYFDEKAEMEMIRRNYVIDRMNHEVENGGFEVFYQPIYCLKEQEFSAAEALIRMRDVNGTLISPGEFIPIAEEIQLIDKIGWIVLDKVCAFIGKHPDVGFKSVSVNMAISQLMDPDFEEKVMSCIRRHHVPEGVIRIEITERTLLEDMGRVTEIMTPLVEKGVNFYLDDFGMGYSNFAGVLTMPLETIKLDLSLVQGSLKSEKKMFVLYSLIEMMKQSGYIVVAEGIETEEDAQILIEMGADRLQGYYYYKPMPEEQILEIFEKKQ